MPDRKPIRGFSAKDRLRLLKEIAQDKRASPHVRLEAIWTAEILLGNLRMLPKLSPRIEKMALDLNVTPHGPKDLLTDKEAEKVNSHPEDII